MLDIALFRDPSKLAVIRESQRRRYKDQSVIDAVIALDEEWRRERAFTDNLGRGKNAVGKAYATLKKQKASEEGDATLPADFPALSTPEATARIATLSIPQLSALSKQYDSELADSKTRMEELENRRDKTLVSIGNIVHESVPVSNNEDDNRVERVFGEKKAAISAEGHKLHNHVDLMWMIDGYDTIKGAEVAGSRGYFLKGKAVLLHLGLVQYAMFFLAKKGYTALYTPFFMQKNIMAEVAQLEQFDDELYKVTGEGEDKYLIATSEQPICAFHRNEWVDPKTLPLKYAGFSTCFRKEVGSHGRDTLGIFRVHQFEKIEQFCCTAPSGNDSWDLQEEMLKNAEEFNQSLGLPYHVVNIVSGALNNAAARKYDLEAWFPASQTYRELVSCSNCTDYQSRRLNTRFGLSKKSSGEKEYVHMLNSTLCATTRTICCILENNQTKEGIVIPEVLRPYCGFDFIPFVKDCPKA
eukprot:ANDGO_08573.mRNA.1 putative serine--tRNA ligase